MIKKKKNRADIITRFGRYITIRDTDPMSRNYFRFSEFPDRLHRGKNMIRLNANDVTLAVGSEIYIEFLDANGNALYHEIIDYIDKDQSRVIVVYVYDDTPIGEFTALFAARSTPITSRSDLSIPNVLWTTTGIVVPSQPTKSDVIFTKQPIITFSEVQVSYLEMTSSVSRYATKKTNDPLAEVIPVSPGIKFESSKEYETKFDSDRFIIKQPDNNTSVKKGKSVAKIDLPTDKRFSIAYLNELGYQSDTVGSTLNFGKIDITKFAPSDVAASNFAIGTVPDYSCSIVKIINNKKAYVFPPFRHTVNYVNVSGEKKSITFNKFLGADTTASYYSRLGTDAITATAKSQSLLVANFSNLDPAVGDVEKLRISYKGFGQLGEFEEFGTYPIERKNLFVNDGVYKTTSKLGVIEEEIGVFHTSTIVTYWTSESFGNAAQISFAYNQTNLIDSIAITAKPLAAITDYFAVTPKIQYAISSSRNTEFDLTFDAYSSPTGSSTLGRPQLDLYISGASLGTEPISYTHRNILVPIVDKVNLGIYIGSIFGGNGTFNLDQEYSFKVLDEKKIVPKFVIRQGNWNLADIKLSPRKSIGFTPNQYKLIAPLTNITRNTEYLFKIDYISQDGKSSNVQSEMYGVRFTGSNVVLDESTVISGSNVDITNIQESFWTASAGYGIYYDQGKVGIATSTPDSQLEITQVGSGDLLKVGETMVFVSASGNVGFGHIDPSDIIHVRGTPPNIRQTRASSGQVWIHSIGSNREFELLEAGGDKSAQFRRFYVADTGEVTIGTDRTGSESIPTITSMLFVTGSATAQAEWDTATFYSPHLSGSYISIMGNTGATTYGRGIKFLDGAGGEWNTVMGTVPGAEEFRIRVGSIATMTLDHNEESSITALRISELTGNTAIGGNTTTARLTVSGNVSMSNDLTVDGIIYADEIINDSLVSATHLTGSFTGSFTGDGSNLEGIVTSQWTSSGLNIFYETGNVAIGTDTPSSYLLTVRGRISASGDIRLGTENTASFLRMRGSTNIIRTRADTPLIFRRGAVEKGRFGTDNQFSVVGSISASSSITASNVSLSGNITASQAQFSTSITASDARIYGAVSASSFTGSLDLKRSQEIKILSSGSGWESGFSWSGITVDWSRKTSIYKHGDLLRISAPVAWEMEKTNAVAVRRYGPAVAIAIVSASAGLKDKFLIQGFISKPNWSFTAGAQVYMQTGSGIGSATSEGTMTSIPPSGTGDIIQVVGVAYKPTVIYFNPSFVTSSAP